MFNFDSQKEQLTVVNHAEDIRVFKNHQIAILQYRTASSKRIMSHVYLQSCWKRGSITTQLRYWYHHKADLNPIENLWVELNIFVTPVLSTGIGKYSSNLLQKVYYPQLLKQSF